jgi:hypothetical protein
MERGCVLIFPFTTFAPSRVISTTSGGEISVDVCDPFSAEIPSCFLVPSDEYCGQVVYYFNR